MNKILVTFYSQAAAAERTDYSRGDRLPQTERVADSHHEIADPQVIRVGDLDMRQVLHRYFNHGYVRRRVGTDNLCVEMAPVA